MPLANELKTDHAIAHARKYLVYTGGDSDLGYFVESLRTCRDGTRGVSSKKLRDLFYYFVDAATTCMSHT